MLLQEVHGLSQCLADAANNLSAAKPLSLPPASALSGVDPQRPASLGKAAGVAEVANACIDCVTAWCTAAEAALAAPDLARKVTLAQMDC